MTSPENVFRIDEITVWVEPGSSVQMRIGSKENLTVELSGDQAHDLADVLNRMADQADE